MQGSESKDQSSRRRGSIRPPVNLFSSGANPFASAPPAEAPVEPPPPPAPPAVRTAREPVDLVLCETPEQTFLPAAEQLVEQFALELPQFADQPKEDQKGLYKVAFATMAKAVTRGLALYQVPAPHQASHLLTLSCHRVVKEAVDRSPESFEDGRLVHAISRLCADFVATMR